MPDGELLEGFLCSECKAMFEGPDSLRQHYSACHLDGNDVYRSNHPLCDVQDTTIQAQQEYIDALLPVVGRHVYILLNVFLAGVSTATHFFSNLLPL